MKGLKSTCVRHRVWRSRSNLARASAFTNHSGRDGGVVYKLVIPCNRGVDDEAETGLKWPG